MRYILTLYFFTISVFGFDYHLKPYTMAKNVVCFFGLGAEAKEFNGGNIANSCFVELKDGYVVIDSGPTYSYAQQAYTIMQNRKVLPVKYVVNTSIDESQILGNGFYKEQGATLLGAKGYNPKMRLTLDKKITADAFINTRLVPLDREITKDTKIKCCTMRIDIDKIIKDNNNFLTVYIPDRELIFVGDMIFNNRIPSLEHGRSLLKWIEAIKEIENRSWKTIISAHGVKTKRSAIKNTKLYLTLLKDRVQESIKKGYSKKEAIKSIKMSSFQDDKLYSVWHKKNIAVAYDELKKITKKQSASTPVIAKKEKKKKHPIKKKKLVKKKRLVKKKKKPPVKKVVKRVPNIVYHSFNSAMSLAKKNKKLVLLKIRSDNCPYCDKLDSIMAKNNNIKKIINNNYKVVYLNNSSDELPLGIKISLTPSLVFVRPDTRKILMIVNGIEAVGELIDILKEAVRDGQAGGYVR